RGAVSIARRLQDPLAELVKIDPKSIGVGQYQHDVAEGKLSHSLDAVVEDCVNAVGVDLNTASQPLLARVSGVTSGLATAIVARRDSEGPFRTRRQLLGVPRLGPKAFEQCAGFLRIRGRDPRPAFATATFAEGVEKLEDLEPGMVLEGVVTNVAAFGAFVDIGVHQDGLVHVSAMSRTFVSDPRSVVKSGDVVRVKVLSVDIPRYRISLTLRLDDDGRPFGPSSRTGRGVRPGSSPGASGR